MKILIDHGDYHELEEWEKTEMFCPECGKQDVWQNDDYDEIHGEDNICMSCFSNFTIQGPYESAKIYGPVIKQLKSGIPFAPTNPSLEEYLDEEHKNDPTYKIRQAKLDYVEKIMFGDGVLDTTDFKGINMAINPPVIMVEKEEGKES